MSVEDPKQWEMPIKKKTNYITENLGNIIRYGLILWNNQFNLIKITILAKDILRYLIMEDTSDLGSGLMIHLY